MHLLVEKLFPFISDACIKEELDDAFDVNIEPVGNPIPNKGFNETLIAKKEEKNIVSHDSMEEITIKEEPQQDELVS